jgi:TM2 domain-containing membrane protein YozV
MCTFVILTHLYYKASVSTLRSFGLYAKQNPKLASNLLNSTLMKRVHLLLAGFLALSMMSFGQNRQAEYNVKEGNQKKLSIIAPRTQNSTTNILQGDNDLTPLVGEMPTLEIAPLSIADETRLYFPQLDNVVPTMDKQLQAMFLANRKDPAISCMLSICVPGMGQFYNGQYLKGVTMMALSYGSLGAAASLSGSGNSGLKSVFLVGALASYLWSLIDAPVTSKSINNQNGYTSTRTRHHRFLVSSMTTTGQSLNRSLLPAQTGVTFSLLLGK